MRRTLPLAAGILLIAGALAALLWTGTVSVELRRLLRATGTDTTVFAQVGRLGAQQTAWATIAQVLLAVGAVVVLAGIAILLLPRARVAGVDRRMLWALPPLAVTLLAAGVVGALDWTGKVVLGDGSVTSGIAAAADSARIAPPESQDTVSTAAVTAGLLVVLTWLAVRAILAPDPQRWLVAIGVVVAVCAAAGLLVLRLRLDGYARLDDLYSGFFTGSPDPRTAGRSVLAVQAQGQILSILGGAPLAAAAVGIPLLVALRAARPRLGASTARELVPDGEAHA